jgi:replicative DNA helicase
MNTSYIYELLGIKLPQSEQTEEAVLGALLKNNKLFYEVDGIVNEDCFLEDRRKRIFVAIK